MRQSGCGSSHDVIVPPMTLYWNGPFLITTRPVKMKGFDVV